MKYLIFPLKETGSLSDSNLTLYLQEDSRSLLIQERPLILLCPGGGYEYTSDREAEPIALKFLAMGYHAAILRYSCAPARFPTALYELASSVALIRCNAKEWKVDAERIIVQGCSAGGHLAASLGVFWKEDFLAEGIGLKEGESRELIRPDGMLLCYPVITSGEFAHRGSFASLLGDREAELSESVSLEKQISPDTPPAFVWHTFEDGSVPVENSLLLVGALRRAGIPTEFHMYPRGGHGLALANRLTATAEGWNIVPECESWIELAHVWIEGLGA